MKNKDIKKLAQEIVRLEKELQDSKKQGQVELEMQKLVSGLSFENLMLVDEYISSNKML
jgi:cytochrome c553